MKDIILADLDSTVSNTSQRHHLAPGKIDDQLKEQAWENYAMACGDDEPIEGSLVALTLLSKMYPIYFVSGRSFGSLSLTKGWFEKHAPELEYESIRLRRPGDPHNNAEYKVMVAEQYRAEGLNPILMFEDWPAVAAAMEAIGIPTLLVNPNYDDSVMKRFAKAYDNPNVPGVR